MSRQDIINALKVAAVNIMGIPNRGRSSQLLLAINPATGDAEPVFTDQLGGGTTVDFTVTNGKLDILGTYLDGVEGKLDTLVTLLTTANTYQDGVEALLGTANTNTAAITAALGLLSKKTDTQPVSVAATLLTRTNYPTSTLTGQTVAVSSTVVALTVPGTATYAEIEVISGAVSSATAGAVRWSKSSNITAGPTTRMLAVGDVVKLRGAEMVAFRAIRDQATDASLHVEYGVDA